MVKKNPAFRAAGASPFSPALEWGRQWLAKQLTQALVVLTRMEHWLRTPGERELTARDREINPCCCVSEVSRAASPSLHCLVRQLSLALPLTAKPALLFMERIQRDEPARVRKD